ncbi:MAG: tRNA glutamyl-Q(34) synthetase GluQRS [Verrucomicrobiota bacterium]|nr:tRNA glutamyl-Q(34) synthetase GluQRS [Verrucomicrobiota bacterium]
MSYRGRIAPTPTGYLHLGHARTFWTAHDRCKAANGTLFFRNENLDANRCKAEYQQAAIEDCRWLGIEWEGEPLNQSTRTQYYQKAFKELCETGCLYPCTCSRKDIQEALAAPHGDDGEAIYPGTCRQLVTTADNQSANWRFRVPEGEKIEFEDAHFGPQSFTCGVDFGDFPVWQKNGVPSYQLAVVVDDAEMGITEVVRGADLLISTARQLLLYRALSLTPPNFYHCELMLDEVGERLAKRNDALSLCSLRNQGKTPKELQSEWT